MLRGNLLPARDRCQLAALDRPRHQHDEHDDRRDRDDDEKDAEQRSLVVDVPGRRRLSRPGGRLPGADRIEQVCPCGALLLGSSPRGSISGKGAGAGEGELGAGQQLVSVLVEHVGGRAPVGPLGWCDPRAVPGLAFCRNA
jgi:hypothetical protein